MNTLGQEISAATRPFRGSEVHCSGGGGSATDCGSTTESTLALLRNLGLHGMAQHLNDLDARSEVRNLEHTEWLALLLEQEQKARQRKRFERRARAARLGVAASVEDAERLTICGLDTAVLRELAAGEWIRARQNLLIIGPSGIGKSWLACALGHMALLNNFSVAYYRMSRLFDALTLARTDGRYDKMLRAIARLDLLILDDWGPERLDVEQRRDLLEIIEDRYESRSTIVTSRLPVDSWYGTIGNPTIAVAVLDRLAHNAHRVELKGESFRKQQRPAPRNPTVDLAGQAIATVEEDRGTSGES